jgi:membrane associated rhomboid family serine protease
MFLHGGILHILSNMLMLWIFGDNIEALIGHKRFLLFYLICGLAAALAQTITNTQSNIPMVGASGAISGCMGAYLVLFPSNKVKILFFIVIFRIAAFIVIGLWAAGQFIATFNTFNLKTAHTQTDNIAYAAHIGGFIAGVLFGLYYKKNIKALKEKNQIA